MRRLLPLCVLGLLSPAFCVAQSACSVAALPQASKTAIAVRHQLQEQAVGENDPRVPPAVAAQLAQMKDALAQAADAAFACAPANAAPEDLEKILATALHANLAQASETVLVTRNKKDLGAYGSDLAVQVFPLFSSPRYYEVNFRYGVECGDDNLLLIYAANSGAADSGVAGPATSVSGTTTAGTTAWHPVLRWGAPSYTTVGDAYGDFVLLTPLSGFPGQRNWRFVVAHGQPGCAAAAGPSHFDLDLLEPTADPAQPQVVWHLEHPYRRSDVPRLSTTEDTLTFEVSAPEKTGKSGGTANGKPNPATVYRFHVGKDNKVDPLVHADNGAALADR
ncbi:MAG: hypothetical protein ACRYFU_02280 [Janthinobacterium lividum]